MRTTSTRPASSRAKSPTNSENRRAGFARGLALDAHRKSAWALHEPDFQDRRPDQAPRRLGEIADKIVAETGQKACLHWIDQAARAKTPQERAAALEIAQNIAKSLGLTLGHFLFKQVA